jgi:hypothetical protein
MMNFSGLLEVAFSNAIPRNANHQSARAAVGQRLEIEITRNKNNAKHKSAAQALLGCPGAANNSEMKRRSKYFLLGFVLLNFTIAGISDAAAYLDPGTGNILFQSIIAVVASALAVIATARQAVTGFFGRLFSIKKDVRKD